MKKTICFSREKFSACLKQYTFFDFSENPRWILKLPLRPRAGWPCWPRHGLCVFLCTPSLNRHESPKKYLLLGKYGQLFNCLLIVFVNFWYIFWHFWMCFWTCLGIFDFWFVWEVLGLFWECFGTCLEHFWICLENVWEVLGTFLGRFWRQIWKKWPDLFFFPIETYFGTRTIF